MKTQAVVAKRTNVAKESGSQGRKSSSVRFSGPVDEHINQLDNIANNPLGQVTQTKPAFEEEEPMQGNFITAQLQSLPEEEEPLQGKFTSAVAQKQENIPVAQNNTGLPDHLKAGVENLSGYSLDDVKVHYNSPKPAQLHAHAYAQGTDIHLASGQEKHLPHEAWHVVQQKQGRVRPTLQMKGGVNVNDDRGLEKEADMVGKEINQEVQQQFTNSSLASHQVIPGSHLSASHGLAPIQMDTDNDVKARAHMLWQQKESPNQSKEDQELDYKMAQGQVSRENSRLDQLMSKELLRKDRIANPLADLKTQTDKANASAQGANQNEYQGDLQARVREIAEKRGGLNAVPNDDDLKKAYSQQQFERMNTYSASSELHASQAWKEKGRPQGQNQEQMTSDYHQGRMRAMLNANPNAPRQSGEFETQKTGGVITSKTFSPLVAALSQGGKISQNRKDLLKGQLNLSGRTTDEGVYTANNPTALPLNMDQASPTFATDLPTTKNNLSRKRPSGVNEVMVGTHLGTILDRNSDDAKFPERGIVGGSAPLGHSHTAHGFQTTDRQQIERALVGVRPDQINTGPDFVPMGGNIPVNMGHLGATDPSLAAINQVSQYPVTASNQNVGFGTASKYSGALSEYNAFGHNFAEGWQEQSRQSHRNVLNPQTGGNFIDAAANRIAVTNRQTIVHGKPVPPPAFGRGFQVARSVVAPAPDPLNFKRNQLLEIQQPKIQQRAQNMTVTDQHAYKTVLERARDAHGRFNGFNAVTNFPDNGGQGISVRVGTTDVPISPLTDPDTATYSGNRSTTDLQNLQSSQQRIQVHGHQTKFEGGGTVYSKPGLGGMEKYQKVEIQGNDKVTFSLGLGGTWNEVKRVPL